MLVAAGCNSRSSFTTMQADTLVIGPYLFFSSRKEQLGALSLRHAVPAIVAAGGLMSYGANEAESYLLVGIYTGKILKGANRVVCPSKGRPR